MNKIFLQNESGRSMVEMLGVLAIMGILTIGGIAGFNYAMDKSKANDILDGVNKRAIALSPLMLLGNDISNNALDAEFGTTIGDSGVALVADATGFDLTVNHVSKNVCDNVLNGGLKSASEIMLGNDKIWVKGVKSDHTCADADNEITFAFNTSLDGTRGSTESDPEDALCRYSPCQTCVDNNDGTQTRGFEPSGTPCEQGGMQGVCNSTGQCVPNEGDSCNSGGSCPTGEFCNYGGHSSWQESGRTPDKCQKARARTKVINGTTYYYPSRSDVRSWCRPADNGTNCTWGYLSYPGAQDWCRAIGKALVSSAEIVNNCAEFQGVSYTNSYWVSGQTIVHMQNNCLVQAMSRSDGYAGAAAVFCK